MNRDRIVRNAAAYGTRGLRGIVGALSFVRGLLLLAMLSLPATVAAQDQAQDLGRQMRLLEQRIAELEAARAAYDDSLQAHERDRDELLRRIEELERAKAAQEDAVRAIIGDAIGSSGSMINDVVTLGGTFEFLTGRLEDFSGQVERFSILNTAEFDFEMTPNDWILARIILEYRDGAENVFTNLQEREVSIDRMNADTATLTIGNPQLFWPSVTVGRAILPFGISTGDPVADVLTIEDPLTLEVFEMRRDAVLFELAFPTPDSKPPVPMKSPPPVRPRVLHPSVDWLARALGYKPPVQPPPEETYVIEPTPPPAFSLGIYHFSAVTQPTRRRRGWRPQDQYGVTAGFRTTGPVSFEIDLDYNCSIFDSRFLSEEYFDFLPQIGLVPGAAANLKAKLGPIPLVLEWNGALEDARFTDGLGRAIRIRPQAWQVSVGYQFDWNRWMVAPGSEGTYLAFGFSQSYDLAGVFADVNGLLERVGTVPENRLLVHAAEWVWPHTRLAFEYEHVVDYDRNSGGTGKTGDAFFTTLTYEW